MNECLKESVLAVFMDWSEQLLLWEFFNIILALF